MEDDGVHHLAELLVVGDAQAGLGDAGVGLQPEPVQPHASEVKHLTVLHCSTTIEGEREKTSSCRPLLIPVGPNGTNPDTYTAKAPHPV